MPQRQKWSSSLPTPLVFLRISTDFTPTHDIPATSTLLESVSSNNGMMVEPPDFTIRFTDRLRNSLRPVTPDNAWVLRMTAAAGT